jgi:hypothetical protein
MAINFPPNPSTDDEFVVAGKAWVWNGLFWKRIKYAIIDGGFSPTEIEDELSTADGGNA